MPPSKQTAPQGYGNFKATAELLGITQRVFEITHLHFDDFPKPIKVKFSHFFNCDEVTHWRDTHDLSQQVTQAYRRRTADYLKNQAEKDFFNQSAKAFITKKPIGAKRIKPNAPVWRQSVQVFYPDWI